MNLIIWVVVLIVQTSEAYRKYPEYSYCNPWVRQCLGFKDSEKYYYFDVFWGKCMNLEDQECTKHNFTDQAKCNKMCKRKDEDEEVEVPPDNLEAAKCKGRITPCIHTENDLTYWYFDATFRACLGFRYNLCSNENNFTSEEECQRICDPFMFKITPLETETEQNDLNNGNANKEEEISVISTEASIQQPEQKEEKDIAENDLQSQIEDNEINKESNSIGFSGCFHEPIFNCFKAANPYFYNKTSKSCEAVQMHWCTDIPNSFPSYKACYETCQLPNARPAYAIGYWIGKFIKLFF